MILLAAGGVPRRGVLGAGLLDHPPVVVEDRECEVTWCAVFVFFDSRATSTILSKEISRLLLMVVGDELLLLFHDDGEIGIG